MHETAQTYDIPVTHVDISHLPLFEGLTFHQRFNALAAGSLCLLRENDLLDKMLDWNAKCLDKGGYRAPDDEGPVKSLINIVESSWCSGIFPHFYGEDEYKVLPTSGIDAEAAAGIIKAWVNDQAEALEALKTYSQIFPRAKYDRGLRMGGVGYEK